MLPPIFNNHNHKKMKFLHIGKADYITNKEMVLGFVNEINTLVGRNIATYFEKPLPNKGVYVFLISNEKKEVIESCFKLLDLTFEYITLETDISGYLGEKGFNN